MMTFYRVFAWVLAPWCFCCLFVPNILLCPVLLLCMSECPPPSTFVSLPRSVHSLCLSLSALFCVSHMPFFDLRFPMVFSLLRKVPQGQEINHRQPLVGDAPRVHGKTRYATSRRERGRERGALSSSVVREAAGDSNSTGELPGDPNFTPVLCRTLIFVFNSPGRNNLAAFGEQNDPL